ncbi:UNVERIFIED_CONTAM: hypothetical protein K2H54_054993 [Gekko kuhli]
MHWYQRIQVRIRSFGSVVVGVGRRLSLLCEIRHIQRRFSLLRRRIGRWGAECSRRIWIGSWSGVDGGRIRHREASPVGLDMNRSESPRGRGSQTAACCKWMAIETVPSPPMPGGRQASPTAGTDRPKAEPTNPSEASVPLLESRPVSTLEPNVLDASKSKVSIPTAS